MKKKLIALLISGAMFLSPAYVFADEKDDRIAELESQVESLQKEINLLKEQLANYESSGINDMEKYLLEENLLTGERTEMAANMVGAISGFKYGSAEIYEYDTESEQYKTLSSGGAIGVEGFAGISVSATAINGKYVLIGQNLSEDFITAFKDYKSED